MYAGQSLPQVSTSSVDINTVDCPYLRESYGINGNYVNPLNLNINIPGLGTLNLSQTSAEAATFLQNSFDDAEGIVNDVTNVINKL